jgi:hypothetical protein
MFSVTLDFSDIANMSGKLDANIKKLAEEAQEQLGRQAHAKGLEFAKERLHSRQQMFAEAWKMDPQDDAFYLVLQAKAVWIDEGLEPNKLFESLMNSPKAQTGQNGKYIVVPFEHKVGSGPTNTTPYQLELVQAVKEEFKKQKIPWQKIQKDDQGRPIQGLIGQVKGINTPIKTHEGPGMGQGAIGDPRQGHTGISFLKGANLYQINRERELPDGKKEIYTQRGAITFRTASQAHPEKFMHPGLEPTNIVESTWDWALNELEKEILPKLVKKLFS